MAKKGNEVTRIYDKLGVLLSVLLPITFVLSLIAKTNLMNTLFSVLIVVDILLGLAVIAKIVFIRRFSKVDWLIIALLALGYGLLIWKTSF